MTILLILLAITAALAGVLQGIYWVKPVDKMHKKIKYPVVEITSMGGKGIGITLESFRSYMAQFDLGPRGHVWHKKAHLIWDLFIIGLAIYARYIPFDWHVLVFHFLLAWTLFELSYNYGRYKQFTTPDKVENVNFFDKIVFHAPSRLMHIIRIVLVAIAAFITFHKKEK